MYKFSTLLLRVIIILGIYVQAPLYGKIWERSCFGYTSPPPEAPASQAVLGTRFIIDHDHAAIAFGAVFENESQNSAWIPYVAPGEGFFPSGLTWEGGLAYCYRNFSLRLAYEGKYNLPSEPGSELFPIIHTGSLISDMVLGPVLLSLLLKYGETWEHLRAPHSTDYFKEKLLTAETGLFLTTRILEIPSIFSTDLYVYTVAAFLTELDEWTLNSSLTLDSTLLPTDFGEIKLMGKIVHIASSDEEEIATVRNMFFLGPFPAKPQERFYEYDTSGFLSGEIALGYRVFPLYSLRNSSKKWASGFYFAPYVHYGWGIDEIKPIDKIETAVSLSVHFGYKLLKGGGTISSSVGWNNKQGFVITVISNF